MGYCEVADGCELGWIREDLAILDEVAEEDELSVPELTILDSRRQVGLAEGGKDA